MDVKCGASINLGVDIETLHLSFFKRVLNVRKSTSNYMVYFELGRFPLYINRYYRMLKYWFKILKTENCILKNCYVFLFRSEFFFRTTRELEYLIFFQNITLGYMTKALNHIFFFLHQNQNIFFSNIGIRIFFLEKTIPCKLNGPSLGICMMTVTGNFIYFDQLII